MPLIERLGKENTLIKWSHEYLQEWATPLAWIHFKSQKPQKFISGKNPKNIAHQRCTRVNGKSCQREVLPYRPVEERRWSSSFCKLRNSSCFGILRRSILRINLVIRLKDERNQLPKIHILLTSGQRKLVDPSWSQDSNYYVWSETCIPLRQQEVLSIFWGPQLVQSTN